MIHIFGSAGSARVRATYRKPLTAVGLAVVMATLAAGCGCAVAPLPTTPGPTPTARPTATTSRPTTVKPTTTVRPTTTAGPSTTVKPTTTVQPTTTVRPTTTAGPSTTVTPTTSESDYRLETCPEGTTLNDSLAAYDNNFAIDPADFPLATVTSEVVGCASGDNGMTTTIGFARLAPAHVSGRPVVLAGPGFCVGNKPSALAPLINGLLDGGRPVVVLYYALREVIEPLPEGAIPATMNDSIPAVAQALITSKASLATLLNALAHDEPAYDLVGLSCGSLIALNALAEGAVDQLPHTAVLYNGGSQIAGLAWDPPQGLGDRLWVLAGDLDHYLPATADSTVARPFVAGDFTTGPDPSKQDASGQVVGNTEDVCVLLGAIECQILPEVGHNLPDAAARDFAVSAGLIDSSPRS